MKWWCRQKIAMVGMRWETQKVFYLAINLWQRDAIKKLYRVICKRFMMLSGKFINDINNSEGISLETFFTAHTHLFLARHEFLINFFEMQFWDYFCHKLKFSPFSHSQVSDIHQFHTRSYNYNHNVENMDYTINSVSMMSCSMNLIRCQFLKAFSFTLFIIVLMHAENLNVLL